MLSDTAGRRRKLGSSDLSVSAIGLGCWPMAGVSTLGVTDPQSLATIHAALDAGIDLIDTAFSYGYDGESDKLLAQVLATRRSEVVIASKVGQHFDTQRARVVDARPATVLAHAQQILQRMGVEQVDIMYLHTPDPQVPIQESAAAISEVIRRGWARYAGVSNVTAEQLEFFMTECPVVVVQPPFNMLQQAEVESLRAICLQRNVSIVCYWALMKGLLAGRLLREHQFDPTDKRLTYPVFQGTAWHRSQDLLDKLRRSAQDLECSVAQLVLAWTLRQPGITVALCGAKRPEQIEETALAMQLELPSEQVEQIDAWIADWHA